MPLRKVHELTFLWFGLPGPLLNDSCSNPEFFQDLGPLPKGPFRTKNATALNSVVFYYRRSFFTICSDLLLNFPY